MCTTLYRNNFVDIFDFLLMDIFGVNYVWSRTNKHYIFVTYKDLFYLKIQLYLVVKFLALITAYAQSNSSNNIDL